MCFIIINHITNYKIFGDKFTHYNLLTKYNKNSKFVLETHLFDTNNVRKIKGVIHKYPIWIIKPRNDYGRNGVTIIRNYSDIQNWIQKTTTQQWILQKYVENPLLIKKKKFHIRIYVIIHKKNNNINIYIYKKGFIYTAGINYNLNSKDLSSHLSGEDNPFRVSVFQKNNPLYPKIWNRIKDLVNECVVSIKSHIQCPNINNQCYKLLGLDILIDDKYNLYLAEINSRLISLKYPPKNFKHDMYTDILNEVYFGNSKGLELVYSTKTINYFIKNYKWF